MTYLRSLLLPIIGLLLICSRPILAQEESSYPYPHYRLYPKDGKVVLCRIGNEDLEQEVAIKLGDTFGTLKKKFGVPMNSSSLDVAYDTETHEPYSVIQVNYKNLSFKLSYAAKQILNGDKDEGTISAIILKGYFNTEMFYGTEDSYIQISSHESASNMYDGLKRVIERDEAFFSHLKLDFSRDTLLSMTVKCTNEKYRLIFVWKNWWEDEEKWKKESGLQEIELSIFE